LTTEAAFRTDHQPHGQIVAAMAAMISPQSHHSNDGACRVTAKHDPSGENRATGVGSNHRRQQPFTN